MPKQKIETQNTSGTEIKGPNVKKQKTSKNKDDEKTSPKRGWESWSIEEKDRFFEALKTHGRDFDNITERVGSKNYEQVRHFYYRLIKKVNSIVKPEAIDKKDPKEIISALLYYWDLKRVYGQREENSSTFASTLRDIIHKLHKGENIQLPSERPNSPDEEQPHFLPVPIKTSQSPPGPLSLRANESLSSTSDTSVDSSLEEQLSLPEPEKIVLQLVPKNKEANDLLTAAKQNPRLQINMKSKKKINHILEYIMNKWEVIVPNIDTIRVYPSMSTHPDHNGWGIEDNITTLQLYHYLGCPPIVRLEYAWSTKDPTPDNNFAFLAPSPRYTPNHSIKSSPPVASSTPSASLDLGLSNDGVPTYSPPRSPSDQFAMPTFTIPLKASPRKEPESPNMSPVPRFPTGSYPIPSALSPFPASPAKGHNENSLSSFFDGDISSDGFGNQDQNDELACKNRYKYFDQPSQDSVNYEHSSDASYLGKSSPAAAVPSSRKSLSFKDMFL